jgi:hypothetical protein
MRRSLSLALIFFIGMITLNSAHARNDVILKSVDTLFYLGGRVVPVNIINMTASIIRYTNEEEAEIREVDRKQIEKIVYRTGKVDVLNRPAFEMISEDDWRHVLVTDDPDEVAWLYERGKVEVTAAAVRNRRTTLRNAEVRLKRQAVSLGANMVLVTDTEFKGGYGDVPSVTMKGIAYGFTPESEE